RAVGKLYLIPDAPLRHIDDAPRHDLAHSTGIGRPGALAFRLEEPVPGLIEGRTKYSNGFGIEVRLRPDQINNAGHPRTPTPKRRRRQDRGGEFSFSWLRTFNSLGRDGFLAIIQAEPQRVAAQSRHSRAPAPLWQRAGGTCARARDANTSSQASARRGRYEHQAERRRDDRPEAFSTSRICSSKLPAERQNSADQNNLPRQPN